MSSKSFVLSVIYFLICFLAYTQKDIPKVYASPKQLKKTIINIRYSSPEEALQLAETLLKYGTENSNRKIECEAYHQLGKINGIMGQNQKALAYYDLGIQIANEINYTEYLVELLTVKGNAFYDLQEDSQALSTYFKALDLAKLNNLKFYNVLITTNIALLKQRAGKFDEAITLYKQSLDFARKYPDENKTIQSNIISNVLMNIGEAYLENKALDSAEHYNKLGLRKSLTANDFETSSNFLLLVGKTYYEKKEYTKALEKLEAAVKMADSIDNTSLKSEAFLNMARCFKQNQQQKLSVEYYLKSLALIEPKNSSPIAFYSEACNELAELYKQLGDTENSLKYYEKYIELTNTNQNQKIKIIEEFHANDIKGLEKERDHLFKSTYVQRLYTLASLILAFILIGFVFYLLYKNKKKNKKNKKLIDQLLIQVEQEEASKKNPIKIDDEKINQLITGLNRLEENQFYLHKDCSLYTVSQQLRTNTTYLSKIVNKYKGKKFNEYINTLRINYAVERIKNDKTFRSYSVKSIAEELGYKSADSFTKYFKLKTKLNPSQFIKGINKIK